MAILVSNSIKHGQVTQLNMHSVDIESLWIKLLPGTKHSMFLCCSYRPPSKYDSFTTECENALSTHTPVLIMGDLNCDLLNNSLSHTKRLLSFINHCNLTEMVHKPTHVTQTSSSHLDVILCSHLYKVRNADTIPFSGSDHLLIFCDLILRAKNEVGSVSHSYVKVHNFNKFDFSIFGDVDTDVWSDLDRLESLDDKVECFNIVMRAVLDLDMCAP